MWANSKSTSAVTLPSERNGPVASWRIGSSRFSSSIRSSTRNSAACGQYTRKTPDSVPATRNERPSRLSRLEMARQPRPSSSVVPVRADQCSRSFKKDIVLPQW